MIIRTDAPDAGGFARLRGWCVCVPAQEWARYGDWVLDGAMAALIDRAEQAGIEAIVLSPALGDFNEDLRHLGINALQRDVRLQIAPDDVDRFTDLCR